MLVWVWGFFVLSFFSSCGVVVGLREGLIAIMPSVGIQ